MIFLLFIILSLNNDSPIERLIWYNKVDIWASKLWTLERETSATNGYVDQDELGALLVPRQT